MSDFLFTSNRRPDGELRGRLEAAVGAVTTTVHEVHGPWGSLAVARCGHDPDPVVDSDGRLTVLLGWPVLHHPELPSAPALDERRRAEVHRSLGEDGAVATAEVLDGPFAALVLDRTTCRVALLTDRMAFIPVFTATGADDPTELVAGSHVDAVARAAGRHRDIDLVAAADFVVHSSITWPGTLYPGVDQFPPAAERAWRNGGWEAPEVVYWSPVEKAPTRYLGRAARTLRRAFSDAVRHGCEGQDRVGLLLSGGEDSRAILGAIPDGVDVVAFSYGDWKNREYRITRKVAELHGATLHFGVRDPDHYLRYERVAPFVGTQHRYTDVHGYGLHRELRLPEMPIVLGGYLSDSLLKANYAGGPKGRSIRRATPRPGEKEPPIIPNAPGLREDLLREVAARREAHLERIARMRPRSADEWLVLWPFSMRATSANLHGNRRLFRTYEPYLSNDVLEIAAAVPQWWKRERLLFHRAMRPFLARSWYVPHGRSRFPFFGPLANVPLGAGIKLARRIRDRIAGEAGRAQGPWPELGDLVRTPTMATRRASLPVMESEARALFRPELTAEEVREAQTRWTSEQQLGFLQLVHLRSADG